MGIFELLMPLARLILKELWAMENEQADNNANFKAALLASRDE